MIKQIKLLTLILYSFCSLEQILEDINSIVVDDKGIIQEAIEHIFDTREDLKNERTLDMCVSFKKKNSQIDKNVVLRRLNPMNSNLENAPLLTVSS